jgi:HD-GYP domain-containing protein (c-di-GMP phosphodiesterase class II)
MNRRKETFGPLKKGFNMLNPYSLDFRGDTFGDLNRNIPLSEKLKLIHSNLKARIPLIDRIAVAVYDPKTDLLKTFIFSSREEHPLIHYQAKLSEAGSLRAILQTGQPRVVNDLAVFARGQHEHTKRIAEQGFGSSYTLPIYMNGLFLGFIFFNSYQKHIFQADLLHELDLFGHLISLMIVNELSTLRMMVATIKGARHITAYRDRETGAHVERTSHYARLIAKELAPKHGFNDQYIEYLFLFSSLHDIGKIGLPDAVLKKTGRLSKEEVEIMKGHVRKGREIVDTIIKDFGLDTFQQINMLRHIAEYHHEAVDGTGYLRGLKGEAIPIEARIITVADIFDALTSRRYYKEAWTNEEAFAALQRLAGFKLDKDCVEALARNAEAVKEIQQRFKEELLE